MLFFMQTLQEFHISIKNCKRCDLYKERTQVVTWDWNPNADIVFIWEWPWKNEDLKWVPFVWAAWKFLDKMLEWIWLARENVFIANTIKCRPPNNRDPKEEEIRMCLPYLEKQLEIISPIIIVTLWRFALNLFFPGEKIWLTHWKILKKGSLKILSLYHPAAALYNWSKKEILIKDFQILKNFIQHG